MVKFGAYMSGDKVNLVKGYVHENIYTSLILRFSSVLVLFTICRVVFYIYNRDLFPGMELERFLKILFGGLRFDLAGLLYLNLPVLILVMLPIRIKFNSGYQRILNFLFLIMFPYLYYLIQN